MLKSHKCQLLCPNCSKILRDPIQLPCEDSICRDHLKEKDVVKQNKIKCKKCNGEFQVKSGFDISIPFLGQQVEQHTVQQVQMLMTCLKNNLIE